MTSCSFISPTLPTTSSQDLRGLAPRCRVFRQRRLACCASSTPLTESDKNATPTLYELLGVPRTPDPKALSSQELRQAYLRQAKKYHPDAVTTGAETDQFDAVARAWEILSDPSLRRVYDTAGEAGLRAIQSIEQRAKEVNERFGDMPGDQLDLLSETGQLVGTLLSAAPSTLEDSAAADEPSDESDMQDACPRSIEEAVYNVEFHEDRSVRYYTLWWIYKFKVTQAESALVRVLRTAKEQTSGGGFALRRRAALALGAVAMPPTQNNTDTVVALEEAFRTDDYFLRYRAAEAIANISYRAGALRNRENTEWDNNWRSGNNVERDAEVVFPSSILKTLMGALRRGREGIKEREENRSGYSDQQSLFDLDAVAPEVRKRLEAVFEQRRQNEQRSRRTTMTPQLGVDRVGTQGDDEPYEWIIKAVSAIMALGAPFTASDVEVIEAFTKHDVPLVRYAALKALYALTGETQHADKIVQALQYGVEHHYSQRVLIRDLGDLGFWQGAQAVAQCPMVENSFKILALKNMLANLDHNAEKPEVRQVLGHMDSLL